MGHSVLPKSTDEGRIRANIDVYDWSIPEDLLAKFSEIEQASEVASGNSERCSGWTANVLHIFFISVAVICRRS
jgi:diketogulonate reductase-like aldo/keto reductase